MYRAHDAYAWTWQDGDDVEHRPRHFVPGTRTMCWFVACMAVASTRHAHPSKRMETALCCKRTSNARQFVVIVVYPLNATKQLSSIVLSLKHACWT